MNEQKNVVEIPEWMEALVVSNTEDAFIDVDFEAYGKQIELYLNTRQAEYFTARNGGNNIEGHWRRELELAEEHYECIGQCANFARQAIKLTAIKNKCPRPVNMAITKCTEQGFTALYYYVQFRNWLSMQLAKKNPEVINFLMGVQE